LVRWNWYNNIAIKTEGNSVRLDGTVVSMPRRICDLKKKNLKKEQKTHRGERIVGTGISQFGYQER